PGRVRLTSTQEASRRPSPAPRPFGRLAKKPRSPGGGSLFGHGTAATIGGPRSTGSQSPSASASRTFPGAPDMTDFDLIGRPPESASTRAAGFVLTRQEAAGGGQQVHH